ncbi:MAG: nuclease [Acidobacteriaceae bacterium]|nr:nuclease [Acidobacteriaceae bacterium]
MGTMKLSDATLTGSMQVQGTRAVLLSSTNITALDHTAPITLSRGGQLLVCTTSQLHLFHSGAGLGLLFGLDRGALELRTFSNPKDVVFTPDIRFTTVSPGSLDLRLRVTRSGDTCVDNHGATSPTLLLTSTFGNATYRVLPGQHVLFEHGDLHQVVDRERSNCGCPETAPSRPLPPNATAAERAAAEHPFPEAESQDLTASPQNPAAYSRAPNTAILSYDANDPFTGKAVQPDAPATAAPAPAPAAPPPPPPSYNFFHVVGRFFKRLFSQD